MAEHKERGDKEGARREKLGEKTGRCNKKEGRGEGERSEKMEICPRKAIASEE